MDETEKMTALKKAYADIILSTAKEAAARVMATERKAKATEFVLRDTKEEALRVLMRMKRMMDYEMSEAESRSQAQQRTIELLEAQLQEAEDIVGNLRFELMETQSELDRLVRNHRQTMIENDLVDGTTHLEEAELHENGAKNSGYRTPSLQSEEAEVVTTSEAEVSALNAKDDANHHLEAHLGDDYYVDSSDFVSIGARSNGPELYKNGCTQRVRASERNLLNGHLSHDEEPDNLKVEKLLKVEKEEGKNCSTPFCGVENGCAMEEDLAEAKEERRDITNGLEVATNSKKPLEGADPSSCKSLPAVSAMKSPEASDVRETSNGHTINDTRTQSDTDVIVPHTFHDADKASVTNEEMKLVNNTVLFSQESVSGNGVGESICQAEISEQNGPLVESDAEASDLRKSAADQDTDDRVLKYTFHRKRKKASVSVDDDVTQRTGKKHIATSEATKSNSTAELSQDSRWMAQVARQLIALSEKKW